MKNKSKLKVKMVGVRFSTQEHKEIVIQAEKYGHTPATYIGWLIKKHCLGESKNRWNKTL